MISSFLATWRFESNKSLLRPVHTCFGNRRLCRLKLATLYPETGDFVAENGDKVAVSGNKIACFGNKCGQALVYLLVERGGRVRGDGSDGKRVDETDRPHQLLHSSQLTLVLRVGELDNEARRRTLSTYNHNQSTICHAAIMIVVVYYAEWQQIKYDA